MRGTAVETAAGARVALSAAVDGLLSAPLEALASSEVTGLLEELEVARRRLDAVDARVLAEVEERRIAGDMGRTSVADLLSVRLRVGRGEARARTARARDLGPRRAVSGEPLEPIHAATSPALADGQINTGHVAVIGETLGHLPASIAAEAAGPAEDFLLTAAEHEEPGALRRTAQLLLARLDQDGLEPREELQQRRRGLTLHHCGDRIKGHRRADRGGRCDLGGRLRLPGRPAAGRGRTARHLRTTGPRRSGATTPSATPARGC